MNEPTFWRTELWHPLTVHFPISLLLLATAVKLAAAFMRGVRATFWQQVGSFLLYLGTPAAWLAVYTGNMAEGIVARQICDPLQLKSHEIAAFTTAWFFTGAMALQLLVYLNLLPKIQKVIRWLTLALLLVGSGYMVYTSHLGAQVVYNQAGGVKVPSANCAEFE